MERYGIYERANENEEQNVADCSLISVIQGDSVVRARKMLSIKVMLLR